MSDDTKKVISPGETEDSMEAGTPVVKDVESSRMESRELPGFLHKATYVLMLVTALYHIYAARFGGMPGIQHVAIHLGCGLAIVYMLYPFSEKTKNSKINLIIDVCVAIFSLVNMVYVCMQYDTLADRVGMPISTLELVFGVLTFLMILEGARRLMGYPFLIIVLCFIVYMFVGPYMPFPFTHSGATLERFVQLFYLQMSGIYGSITRTSASVVVVYVIFAAIVKNSQIGDFIMDFAMALVGGVRGGPAKVAVVSSGFMGMLSGNSVANVAGTGSITIPMMKKTGYDPAFAGGVEAVASTGGQIMPPVMGASVFIMVELVGTSYANIVAVALPIALFYYFGLLLAVDLTAVRENLSGLQAAERPKLGETLKKGWYLASPIVVLAGLMAMGVTPQRAGFWGIISAFAVSFICPHDRMTVKKALDALCEGVKDCCVMFCVSSLASLIQGIVQVSGIGVKLSSILVTFSNGNLLILLILTMICCIILGMGLPVVVCYSFLALLVCPALVQLGVPLMAAHMFVFYFGCISCITPPVATASLVASGIAKASFMKTGLQACILAFPIFFFPFYFVYEPDFLVINGYNLNVLITYITVLISVYGAACGFMGCALPAYDFHRNIPFRVLLVALAIVVLIPIPMTNIIGSIGIVAVQVLIMFTHKKKHLGRDVPQEVPQEVFGKVRA